MKEPVEAGRPLADALASETARRDLTQEEVAALLGTTQQTVGKWINNRTRPSDSAIPAIAKFLGMTQEKVRQLRGPMRADPRDRQLMRRQVDVLTEEVASLRALVRQQAQALESLAQRIDALGD